MNNKSLANMLYVWQVDNSCISVVTAFVTSLIWLACGTGQYSMTDIVHQTVAIPSIPLTIWAHVIS